CARGPVARIGLWYFDLW
nr:immunoglobulin heavy chain junction region [Macaca mulatta]MOV40231.1 immunoglobulin heavy chain junction region [Macaca mulatta]MOV41872.1 immunoglobulin heavy chain junction region [Macaca mulatta]MOV45277.1 immunoglobulin heavy chain junction region [Macaca mulatta]MOV45850.1 immunoglobulin heavy chain junction region [Macaca mulatta]